MHYILSNATNSSIDKFYGIEIITTTDTTIQAGTPFVINMNIANKSYNSGLQSYGVQNVAKSDVEQQWGAIDLSYWYNSAYIIQLQTVTRVSPVDFTPYIWIGTVSGVAIAAIIIVLYVRHGKSQTRPSKEANNIWKLNGIGDTLQVSLVFPIFLFLFGNFRLATIKRSKTCGH